MPTNRLLPARRSVDSRVVSVAFACMLFVIAVAAVAAPIATGTAHAHTGFESSDPADGAAVAEPVETVTVTFTGEATPVGDQFVALTPDGVVQRAAGIDTPDDKVFTVRFDPPLAGGQVGIRWNVQAADAHPIEGAFSFAVTAPAPTSTPPTTPPPVTAVLAPATPTTAPDPAVARQTLDEFLVVDSTAGETTLTIGHVVGFLGTTIGIGSLAFVATALRGRRGEVIRALALVRLFGLAVAVGAVIEYVGVTRVAGGALASGWSTAAGFAAVLRVVGGTALAFGVVATLSSGGEQSFRRPPGVRSLSAAVIDGPPTRPGGRAPAEADIFWVPDRRSWPAFAGVVSIVVSFWFGGHTVSKGFRPVHALVNSVHVVAGSIWVGGVVAMAAVIWSRSRHHRPMHVVELVVRFSKVATVALASVVAAGVVMAFLVLDSFGELTGTEWGQILLLKSAAVGLAMLGGAYNHFRLLPALEAEPESPERLAELRSIVTAEAIMLVFVVVVTARLVAAAS